MKKVIITVPNGKSIVYKTRENYNIPFNALAPNVKEKFFKKTDLDYIEENLVRQGFTADNAKTYIAVGAYIYSVPMDGRKKEARKLGDFSWDKAYQFIKDNKDE